MQYCTVTVTDVLLSSLKTLPAVPGVFPQLVTGQVSARASIGSQLTPLARFTGGTYQVKLPAVEGEPGVTPVKFGAAVPCCLIRDHKQ